MELPVFHPQQAQGYALPPQFLVHLCPIRLRNIVPSGRYPLGEQYLLQFLAAQAIRQRPTQPGRFGISPILADCSSRDRAGLSVIGMRQNHRAPWAGLRNRDLRDDEGTQETYSNVARLRPTLPIIRNGRAVGGKYLMAH